MIHTVPFGDFQNRLLYILTGRIDHVIGSHFQSFLSPHLRRIYADDRAGALLSSDHQLQLGFSASADDREAAPHLDLRSLYRIHGRRGHFQEYSMLVAHIIRHVFTGLFRYDRILCKGACRLYDVLAEMFISVVAVPAGSAEYLHIAGNPVTRLIVLHVLTHLDDFPTKFMAQNAGRLNFKKLTG